MNRTCLAIALLACTQAYAQLVNGERYAVSGAWDGRELLARELVAVESGRGVESGRVTGRLGSVHPDRRLFSIGPLTIGWTAATEFRGMESTDLAEGIGVSVSLRREPAGMLMASAVERVDNLDPNQLRLEGVVSAGSITDPDDALFTIFDVPIQWRGGSTTDAMPADPAPVPSARTATAPAAASAVPAARTVARTDGPTAPDTSKWACEYCLFDFGTTSTVEAGAGHVSTDSFKFGQYTGLEEGAFGIVDWRLRNWSDDGRFWNVDLHALGNQLYGASVAGGRQGRFDVSLGYEQLPVLVQDTSLTPFTAAADGTLFLASDWVSADMTDGMTFLARDLRNVDLELEKQRVTLEGTYYLSPRWEAAVKYRHDEKSGHLSTGAAIGGPLIAGLPFQTRSSIISQPIDYVMDSVDASVSFTDKRSHMALSYYGSFFDENADVVTWQNPFIDPTNSGADFGRALLPANNQFHQFSIVAAHRLSATTRINGRIAAGRMTQDDLFLPFTINPNVSSTLPFASLDGTVDTLNGQLRISSRPLPKLDLNATLSYNDRDNGTAQAVYNYVITDTTPSSVPRMNLPYSYTRSLATLSAAYRLAPPARITLGYEFDERERTFQDIDRNQEDSVWGEILLNAGSTFSAALKYTVSDRDGSELQLEPAILPATNPLLRKFNMAVRERNLASGYLTFMPSPAVSIGLNVQYADDEYTQSQVGLTDSSDVSYTVDLSIAPAESSLHWYGFVSHQSIEATQLGSQAFAIADWSAITEDVFDTFGVNIEKEFAEDGRFAFGIDYFYSESQGKIDLQSTTATLLPFPDLETTLHHVQAYLDYQATERFALRFAYLFEDYQSSDWSIDGVTPATIGSVLSLGEQSFNYDAHVPMISFRYAPSPD